MPMTLIRSKRIAAGLDMTPLIDIVFQLLIFFMLSSAFASPAMKLALPKARASDPLIRSRIVIAAAPDGQVTVNGQPTTLDQLPERLRMLLQQDPTQPVRFEGDRLLSYQFFMSVTDAARSCGIRHLDLAYTPDDARRP